ncbi:tRNA (adenosine(37)-N6)-threonylcarbamoyltransferase complex ATPase subunit type 1 TsaE [Hydrogenothermus marinus]|uniref:tRNA threonylcarbamoyladenosine biosynthesis protein TsaE n=1 Tax=Hydrogenothermus marinus TaxID=133270 RepID=A0A3M0BHQ6_9AQUI|nr:tRNA (adenosine(37)-N6)-threonylcarbamoyltransferase complex ATPase subunit type 1 TsaE [Hydrogenothermus marinus]RMA95994.1 tRNA threonylcarbamoyladenosine biosynthesis protein TsaE [Hydrogenothermus marinus]
MIQKRIKSLKELREFAKQFLKCLKGNEIILLYGNLGAGKTTFTKYLVSSIDESLEDEVNSPTFTVMNIYETEKFPIYHIDLYRVKDFDITDIIGTGLIIIEWAEYMDFEDIEYPIIKVKINIKEDERIFNIEEENDKDLEECLRQDN